ncbi:MAG: helicase, Snf2 family [uncultured Paraburkholderia sp.]|nr:MAG: helicase, Snf2 family [uncultured Paraburkholderia sp.]
MQRYLQYDELKARGIVHFDAWASTFGQVVTGWELDATGVNYRLNSRFSKFQNVPELISLYRTFADVITKSDLDRQAEERGTRFPVPKIKGGRPQNIIVERSEAQALFMGVQTPVLDDKGEAVLRGDGMPLKNWNSGSIIHRMENLPKDPRVDNPLKITNDARKAGLDFRLINPHAADDAGSKINTAIDNIYRIWEAWKDRKGTQLVFCDLSTPKLSKKAAPIVPADSDDEGDDEAPAISMDELLASNADFSVYDDIKAKLIARGVPEHEIRFIHEATTDLQKAKLFDDMNRGHSRIMLGSTAKMGAGTNVQWRLVAEHHLDAPCRGAWP